MGKRLPPIRRLATIPAPPPDVEEPGPSSDRERALRTFVGGGETHASRLRRSEPGERVHVLLPPDVAQELRLAAVRDRRSVSDLVTEVLRAHLKSRRA